MTDCGYVWTDFSDSVADLPKLETLKGLSGTRECKDICESNDKCSSINMVPGKETRDCELLSYPYDENTVGSSKGLHCKVDRTTRTVERCIGDYEGKALLTVTQFILLVLGTFLAMFALLMSCLLLSASESFGEMSVNSE